MTAFSDLDDVVAKMTGANNEAIWAHKVARIAGAAATAPIIGRMQSLWTFDGHPSAGVAPTTVAIPDNTTAGGLKQADPGGGREKFLMSLAAAPLTPGTLILYDRLLHIGGLSGTVVSPTAQTVGGTLTRYTNGIGNWAWAEIYTQIGASSTTITMSYTDQGAASGNTSPAVAIGNTNFREATRCIMLPLASGDTGIQAIASVTLAATTGTAGNFGVTIGHPLAIIDCPGAGMPGIRSFLQGLPAIPEVETDACLAWLWMPNSTTAPEFQGCVAMTES